MVEAITFGLLEGDRCDWSVVVIHDVQNCHRDKTENRVDVKSIQRLITEVPELQDVVGPKCIVPPPYRSNRWA